MRQRVSVARYADRGTGCSSIIVIQPVERYADRFCSRRIFIHERLVRPRSRFADFPLDSPPVVRPESEIQISSIVDAVVSFLRSRPSRQAFEATRFSTLLSRRCDVANLRASRSRIAAVFHVNTGCESLTARATTRSSKCNIRDRLGVTRRPTDFPSSVTRAKHLPFFRSRWITAR